MVTTPEQAGGPPPEQEASRSHVAAWRSAATTRIAGELANPAPGQASPLEGYQALEITADFGFPPPRPEGSPEEQYQRKPLLFREEAQEEFTRLQEWKRDDPISLQDALNTSAALVSAVKEEDLEELREVVSNSLEGEILQAFVIQAVVIATRKTSLEIIRELLSWGAPLWHNDLAQLVHLVIEVTTRENFSSAWRIVQLLTEGNGEGKLCIDSPRPVDGWTPLCIACATACLPMAFKLLELQADPNMVTRRNEVPMTLARLNRPDDTQHQTEARGIIQNMLRTYGGADSAKEAVTRSQRPKAKCKPGPETVTKQEDGSELLTQTITKTHTRFCG